MSVKFKFKVGDKLKCRDQSHMNRRMTSIGSIHEIISIKDSKDVVVTWGSNNKGRMLLFNRELNCFELVEEEKSSKWFESGGVGKFIDNEFVLNEWNGFKNSEQYKLYKEYDSEKEHLIFKDMNNMYCSCSKPSLKQVSSSMFSDDTHAYCVDCKKEFKGVK